MTANLHAQQQQKVCVDSQLLESQRDCESLRLDCETYQVKLKALDDEVAALRGVVDQHRESELEEEKRLVELELEKERGRMAGELLIGVCIIKKI